MYAMATSGRPSLIKCSGPWRKENRRANHSRQAVATNPGHKPPISRSILIGPPSVSLISCAAPPSGNSRTRSCSVIDTSGSPTRLIVIRRHSYQPPLPKAARPSPSSSSLGVCVRAWQSDNSALFRTLRSVRRLSLSKPAYLRNNRTLDWQFCYGAKP